MPDNNWGEDYWASHPTRTVRSSGGDPGDLDTEWGKARDAKIDAYQKKSRKRYRRRQAEQKMDPESKEFFEVPDPKKVAARLLNGG